MLINFGDFGHHRTYGIITDFGNNRDLEKIFDKAGSLEILKILDRLLIFRILKILDSRDFRNFGNFGRSTWAKIYRILNAELFFKVSKIEDTSGTF